MSLHHRVTRAISPTPLFVAALALASTCAHATSAAITLPAGLTGELGLSASGRWVSAVTSSATGRDVAVVSAAGSSPSNRVSTSVPGALAFAVWMRASDKLLVMALPKGAPPAFWLYDPTTATSQQVANTAGKMPILINVSARTGFFAPLIVLSDPGSGSLCQVSLVSGNCEGISGTSSDLLIAELGANKDAVRRTLAADGSTETYRVSDGDYGVRAVLPVSGEPPYDMT